METFANVVQAPFDQVFNTPYRLKGKWNPEFFEQAQPLTLELGCGKGEYTVGLGRLYPHRNFMGVDIKGNRIWRGAKTALEAGMKNVAFLRTRIDFIGSFFGADEIHEIWITFPDPQLKKPLKRLTSSRFLNRYRTFLQPGGTVNLKTDSAELYAYTKKLAEYNQLPIETATDNLYHSGYNNEILSIKTFYEKMWLQEGKAICYIRFSLNPGQELQEPPDESL